MNKPEQVKADLLNIGDVIRFEAKALKDSEVVDFSYAAMIIAHKYGRKGNTAKEQLVGFEVLILAPPGTFRGGIGGHSVVIRDKRILKEMGLDGDHRLHFNPVSVPSGQFPDLHADTFKSRSSRHIPAPHRLGFVDNRVLNAILEKAQELDRAGDMQILSLSQLEKIELFTAPSRPTPKPSSEFKKATYDVTLENAAKLGLMDESTARWLSKPENIISKKQQVKAGIIAENDEQVGPITTIRQLEKALEEDEEKLRAFFGFTSKGVMYQRALKECQAAVKGFNAAAEGETIHKPPYKELVFEVSPEGP